MPTNMDDVRRQLRLLKETYGSNNTLSLYCINRLEEGDIPPVHRTAYQNAKTDEERQNILHDALSYMAESLKRRGVKDPDKVGLAI